MEFKSLVRVIYNFCTTDCILIQLLQGVFFQSKSEESALKTSGKYSSKIVQQRRRNRITRVCFSENTRVRTFP